MVKILVIDDETDVCEFTKSFFKKRGFEVFTSTSGEKGISIAQEMKPDIVLLDIIMKDIDGITVLKRIKEIGSSAIVIMVTAIDDIGKMEEAKKLGAVAYLTKPLILAELERKITGLAQEISKRDKNYASTNI
ncbi:MAG: hypothetical protein COS99_08665 [Candidatus Omnitrophica bacterium CG07_land_8_20_14_0_80_42_15]|uniref:Response regulatory domain-containing protein n=1 Tax=Candidatus Aquitaenariimonas noxiae TaxID=1974741 RepID=A0A2J0KU08_9BACT|nr:MAG: hypothetical protein COS99_08665 [Candidatus Omnitrophica bacterium CG07_land_8_20_14_0_80_42_15]